MGKKHLVDASDRTNHNNPWHALAGSHSLRTYGYVTERRRQDRIYLPERMPADRPTSRICISQLFSRCYPSKTKGKLNKRRTK